MKNIQWQVLNWAHLDLPVDLLSFKIVTRVDIIINLQKPNMADTKITFPKLKSLSERQTTITNKYLNSNLKTLSTQQPKIQVNTLSLDQRLNNIKIKYINKSPNYFRQKNRSYQTIEHPSDRIQTIEKYLEEMGKSFDKQALLEVAKSRVKKTRLLQYEVSKKQKEFSQNNAIVEQTKYSNFRPARFPIRTTIKSMYHADLTLPIRL